MSNNFLDNSLDKILQQYGRAFTGKAFAEESMEEDDLMLVFGLTQQLKAENKQYWGRELGMCWQRLVVEICKQTRDDFGPGIREGADEICDLVVGTDAIDTKYRIGSGDSGTLKKFRQYAARLANLEYKPVLLILRNDNLPQAIASCIAGGWDVRIGPETYEYIQNVSGFNLQMWLKSRKNTFALNP